MNIIKNKKLVTVSATLLTVILLMGACGAKEYPSRNINVVIPYSAGGPTDMSVRGLLEFSELPKGISFMPINKTGAGGIVGFTETANSKNDGYNIGTIAVDLLMHHYQGKTELSLENYIPLAATIADPYGLVVGKDAPYNTIEEFIQYAKSNPGKLQIGNTGAGGAPDLAAKAVFEKNKLEVSSVPYSGSADCIAAIVGGHIDGTFTQLAPAKSQIDAGELKMIGVLGEKRLTALPNVETFKEAGIDLIIRGWVCVVAPKGTSDAHVTYLRDLFAKSVQTDAFKDYVKKLGLEPVQIVGESLTKMLAEDDLFYKGMLEKK